MFDFSKFHCLFRNRNWLVGIFLVNNKNDFLTQSQKQPFLKSCTTYWTSSHFLFIIFLFFCCYRQFHNEVLHVRYSFGLCLRIFRSVRTVRSRQFGRHLQPEGVHQFEMSRTRQHVLRPLRLSNRHPQMPLRLLERAAGLRKT